MDNQTATARRKDNPREARVELRMTVDEKADVERVASMGGETISAFMRRVAVVEARARIAKLSR